VAAARAVLGPGKLIGISTRTVEQARQAEAAGADYIGLGAMFATGSKGDAELVGWSGCAKCGRRWGCRSLPSVESAT